METGSAQFRDDVKRLLNKKEKEGDQQNCGHKTLNNNV